MQLKSVKGKLLTCVRRVLGGEVIGGGGVISD
jgi:hypothetical protein